MHYSSIKCKREFQGWGIAFAFATSSEFSILAIRVSARSRSALTSHDILSYRRCAVLCCQALSIRDIEASEWKASKGVIIGLQKMRRERVPERVTGDSLGKYSFSDGFVNRSLDMCFVKMIST